MSDDLTAVVRENLEAFNAGDWDRMRETITPGSVYVESATGRRVEGADAIIEVNEGWKAAFPDAQGTVDAEFACGDRAVMEVTWRGTHDGPLGLPTGGAIPPSGRKIEVPAAQVCRIEDGRLAEVNHYFDMLSLLEQIGTISAEALAEAT
jgi:steroid delta-isomerase-like uncharacterized protein